MVDPVLHKIANDNYRKILSRKKGKIYKRDSLVDRGDNDYLKPGRWIYLKSILYIVGILLLVGTIIGMFPWAYRLHASYIKATNHAQMDERGRKTLERMKEIEQAIMAYQQEYRRIPPLSNSEMILTLAGRDIEGSNPNKIQFFKYIPPRVDVNGRKWPGNISENGRIYDYYAKPFRFRRVNWKSGPHIAILSEGKRASRKDDDIVWAAKIIE